MNEPREIRLLTDLVINKIAAGEVVERPASVVKELLENALDAGATSIDVEVVEGGRKLICVADNGCGMSPAQAHLAIQRHATSKIRDVHDIERIGTMGFRGEALAAIPAVSRFSLKTRARDEVGGCELVIHGGQLIEDGVAGCPPGTQVEVRNLFYNVPGRRKFMRAPQTELAHIRQLLLMYAMAFPAVGFVLVSDGRELMRLNAGMAMDERLHQLFDRDMVSALRPVDFQTEGLRVQGYAALPRYHRSDRSGQYCFINRRPASAPLLGYAISQAYEQALPRGRKPVVILFVEIEPDQVDVNVHPAKKEVRFRRPTLVRDSVLTALQEALIQKKEAEQPFVPSAEPPLSPSPEPDEQDIDPLMMETAPPRPKPRFQSLPYPHLGRENLTLDDVVDAGRFESPAVQPTEEAKATAGDAERTNNASLNTPPEAVLVERKSPWGRFRVVGRIRNDYVVLETDEGMVLLDPQAAHERVLFEDIRTQMEKQAVASQGLLSPEMVELTPLEAQQLRSNISLLEQMGFGISEFGGDAFLVDALPACFSAMNAATLLRELVSDLDQGRGSKSGRKWNADAMARSACRVAVHRNMSLSDPEIHTLINRLAEADMPYTCPHGRPTVIFMSYNELARKFGRK